MNITDGEILSVLELADSGSLGITTIGEDDWHAQYSGVMEFQLSNGWSLAVFNDCLSWDYIEWIKAPDGRIEEFADKDCKVFTDSEMMSTWEPKHPERWGVNLYRAVLADKGPRK